MTQPAELLPLLLLPVLSSKVQSFPHSPLFFFPLPFHGRVDIGHWERRKEGKLRLRFSAYILFLKRASIRRRSGRETMEFVGRSIQAWLTILGLRCARSYGLRVEGTLRKIRKAYPHERGLVKETCACLVLLPLQLMSTHSQLIRTVCIDYCIPLVAPRIGFTVKARPNEPPRRKKPELDVPIRPPELWIPDVFSSFARRLRVRRNARGAREPIPVLFYPRLIREIVPAFRVG